MSTVEDEETTAAGSPGTDWWRHPDVLLGAFLVVFFVSALVAQSRSLIPASEEGAPIEAFTSGLLWIIAMFGLVRASEALQARSRVFFWLLFTAGVGALAVDEISGIHERTEPSFNDDWVKVVLWAATPVILWFIARIESAPRSSTAAMMIGYVFHTAYLLVEVGDGEIFSLGIAADTLKTSEEVFELLFLAFYGFALWSLLLRGRRKERIDAATANR